MKAEVLNTINDFTIKISMEGVTRSDVCKLADKVNEIPGFQTTEIIFLYSGKESFIKVYSESKTAVELEDVIIKLGL